MLAAALGISVAGVLSGCGIRTEDGAPSLPLVPGRAPLPGEDVLVTLVASARRPAYDGAPGDIDAQRLLDTQHRVLRDALLRAGVPEQVIDLAPPADSPAPPADDQAGAELAIRSLEVARDDFLPLVGTLTAQRIAATTWAGTAQSWPHTAPQPWRGEAATAAGRAVQGVRAAVWALQVVAARTRGATRARAASTLDALWSVEQDLLVAAGGKVPRPPLGYALPEGAPRPAAAAELADTALRRLREQLAAEFTHLAADRSQAVDLSTWLAAVEVQAHRWGTPYTAFPGLKTPA